MMSDGRHGKVQAGELTLRATTSPINRVLLKGECAMKCANPHCNAEGMYLRSGSLHVLDFVAPDDEGSDDREISRKIVWLCGNCTTQFEIETWRPPGQQLRLRNPETPQEARVAPPRIEMRFAAQRLAS
jgi:hypothetical protein